MGSLHNVATAINRLAVALRDAGVLEYKIALHPEAIRKLERLRNYESGMFHEAHLRARSKNTISGVEIVEIKEEDGNG